MLSLVVYLHKKKSKKCQDLIFNQLTYKSIFVNFANYICVYVLGILCIKLSIRQVYKNCKQIKLKHKTLNVDQFNRLTGYYQK